MNNENFIMPVKFPHSPVKPNSIPTNSTFKSIFIPVPEKEPEKYISLSDIRREFQPIIGDPDCSPHIAARISLAIEFLPSSNVIPAQCSHWIKDTRNIPVANHWLYRLFNKDTKNIPVVKCSSCGAQRKAPLPYCSNCGSKMNKKVYNS